MRFTLTIQLGNEAMQTAEDVQDVLRKFIESQRLTRFVNGQRVIVEEDGGSFKDINGNTVGNWEVTE